MLVALALGLGGVSLAAQVWWRLPTPQGRQVKVDDDVVGVLAGRSYSWVVSTDDPKGVVLIDAGSEPAASRIFAELRKGEREVRAVLLTHAHGDQIRGLEAFSDVPVYVAAAERPLLAGEVEPGGWLSRFYAAEVPLPSDLRLVEPNESVVVDGQTFVAVPTPGHTAGSVTWWWRDVLFTGGALLAASPPAISPSGLNDDDDLALESLAQLLPLDFDVVADARTGRITTARQQLHWLLGADLVAPTSTLLGGEPDGPAVVERRGTYVEDWAPGPDGRRPGLVVDPHGRATVVSDPARAEHRALVGHQVVATGTQVPKGIASDQLTEVTLVAEERDPEGDGLPPLVTTAEALTSFAHRWVVVEGALLAFVPWTDGARFGEGRLELEDGIVPVTGPAGLAVGPLAALGRVVLDGEKLTVNVVAACPSTSRCRSAPVIVSSDRDDR